MTSSVFGVRGYSCRIHEGYVGYCANGCTPVRGPGKTKSNRPLDSLVTHFKLFVPACEAITMAEVDSETEA